jgi:hypothetical protein
MVRKIEQLTGAGIKPTFAFLVAPPSHEAGISYDETVITALEAQAAGADILLNPLSLYSGTAAKRKAMPHFEPDEVQVRLMMDVPEIAISNPFAEAHPNLFPFHSRFVSEGEWASYLATTHCTATLLHTYPKTLWSLWEEEHISPGEIVQKTLDHFNEWSTQPKHLLRGVEQDIGKLTLEEVTRTLKSERVLMAERSSAHFDALEEALPR